MLKKTNFGTNSIIDMKTVITQLINTNSVSAPRNLIIQDDNFEVSVSSFISTFVVQIRINRDIIIRFDAILLWWLFV